MIGLEEQQADAWREDRSQYLRAIADIIDDHELPDKEVAFRVFQLTYELMNEHPNDE